MTDSPLMDSGFVVPVFSLGDDPIACLNKAMAFLTVVASLRSRGFSAGQAAQTIIPNNAAFQTKDLDTYDSDCYQNPFHLKKAQRIKPTLYDGIVISAKHVAMPMIDDEETLILEEESQSKILCDDLGKRFTPQQELSVEQTFWLRMSNPVGKPFDASLVKIEAPKELLKVSLVNESLKKVEFHLAKFDNVVKIRTTHDAHTEEFFENNDLKAQLPEKDSTICKLKDIIKSMREKSKEENVKYDYCEIETKNVELENSVAKFLSENEHLCKEINHVKQVFKEQFESIKKTRVHTKEQSDSLIDKLNLKSVENEDLKAQIQDKNRVVEPIHDVDVKHSLLNANSELICATCKKSMFDGVHDMCLLNFVENVNRRAKSAKKHKKQNI
ncbi:hypothetical protein Tco_0174503 [Tanacetum coccineum]